MPYSRHRCLTQRRRRCGVVRIYSDRGIVTAAFTATRNSTLWESLCIIYTFEYSAFPGLAPDQRMRSAIFQTTLLSHPCSRAPSQTGHSQQIVSAGQRACVTLEMGRGANQRAASAGLEARRTISVTGSRRGGVPLPLGARWRRHLPSRIREPACEVHSALKPIP